MSTTTPIPTTAATVTTVPDFTRSFLRFRTDVGRKPPKTVSHAPPFQVNNVRVPLESVLTVLDRQTNLSHRFFLTANCKAERVSVPRDVWPQPNADVTFVAADEHLMIVKKWDHIDRSVMLYPESLGPQPPRQIVRFDESFDDWSVNIRATAGSLLQSTEQVIAAVFEDVPLVSKTEIRHGRYVASIEYPVKTINVSERDRFYQVDTGPVLLPDLEKGPADLLASLELAFVAHNSPDWSEFIVRVPTRINEDVSVLHYSNSVRWNCRNSMIRVGAAD